MQDLNNATAIHTLNGYHEEERVLYEVCNFKTDPIVLALVDTEMVPEIYLDYPIRNRLQRIQLGFGEFYSQAIDRMLASDKKMQEFFDAQLGGQDSISDMLDSELDKESVAYFLIEGMYPVVKSLKVPKNEFIRLIIDK